MYMFVYHCTYTLRNPKCLRVKRQFVVLTDRHSGEIASWLLPYDPSAHTLKALDWNLGDGGCFKDITTLQSAGVAWKQAAFGDVISLKSATVAIRFKLPRRL